jgi:hypothetical protein
MNIFGGGREVPVEQLAVVGGVDHGLEDASDRSGRDSVSG